MAKYATAGAKFYIGTTAAATDLTTFEADTYIEVGEVEDFGTFGDTANAITGTAVGDARVTKKKGSRDAGTQPLVCFRDWGDAGQAALRAAMASDLDFNFHVVLDDAPAGGTATEFYFRGLVMSTSENIGPVDNLMRTTFNIAINSEILEVAGAVAVGP